MPNWLLPEIRPLSLLGAFLLAWIILPAVGDRFFRTAAFEFQAPVWNAAATGGDLVNYWALRSHSKHDLIEAGQNLARLNAAFRLQAMESESLRAYIRRLEALLDIYHPDEFLPIVARVSRRDLNAWWHEIIIRKGRRDGVEPGAAVVAGFGIVGRVREVFETTSRVELISHYTYRMAAHLEGDIRPIAFSGGQNVLLGNPYGRVRDIAQDVRISPDDPRWVLSSRLGGVFPDGYLIGQVNELRRGSDGLYQVGRVQLNSEILTLQEVTVLIRMEEDQ